MFQNLKSRTKQRLNMHNQDDLDRAFNREEDIRYLSDCERIVQVARDNSLSLTVSQAQTIWEAYSDMSAAGWLMLGEDDEIMNAINWYIRGRL